MLLARLRPRSLAGRLMLFLVIALALAQIVFVLLINTQRDRVVSSLLHSQSLNQTVTLVHLLEDYPAADADRIVTAFASHEFCAIVKTSAPSGRAMTTQEQQLAMTLGRMLNDAGIAGSPQVIIETAPATKLSCGEASPALPSAGEHGQHNAADLRLAVPLLDGRWLDIQTSIDLPPDFDFITVLSFLLSSFAVGIVVIVVVRNQTRSLRALADASERFGRGEKVAPLMETGPIEVTAATHAFNIMQERLGEFLRDRMRLLAGVSHDLRTPITTLRLKVEFIEDDEVREDLVRTVEELATICEATLAFSHAEATSEETSVVDLGELVREVDAEFTLAECPLTEGQVENIRYACRPVALKRAIRNLVENAIRYGGRAQVSVYLRGGQAVVDIIDAGPGIPAERLEEAFQPFVRLEPSRSHETGGIGLGLAIAKGIVAAHGGTLTLSNLQPGLRAQVALPLLA